MKTHRVMLLCCAAMWMMGACGSQATEVEESPPPAASQGSEAAPPVEAEPAPEPAPVAAQPAAQPPAPPEPEPPTAGAVISHQVKSYDAWKKAFDKNEGMRARAGVVGHGVSLDADKKNTVVVYLGSDDLESLQAFLRSKELKQAMKDAGAQGQPKITYMVHADSEPAKGQPELTAMVNHKVADFDTWKEAFDANADARSEAGVIGTSISQDPEDSNMVHVYLEGSDADQLRAFIASKELKDAMKAAGVKGKPKVSFMEPKEMKFYSPDAADQAAEDDDEAEQDDGEDE